MSFYVVGGYDPSPHICSSLSEAYELADQLLFSNDNIPESRRRGINFIGNLCPVEIFTEEEWKNAVRCD